MTQSFEQLYAEVYDLVVPDWEGEINFYSEYALQAKERGQPVLEIACGTGRVTMQLAKEGVNITGMDIDEEALNVARKKSEGVPNVGWVRADMRSFDLGRTFGLIIVPGHSFANMCTPEDQVKALEAFKRHLTSDGTLIIHINHDDVDWLGDLARDQGGKFEPAGEVVHPQTGHVIRKWNAWSYTPSSQIASVATKLEEIGDDGSVLHTWERKPMPLHPAFPFEIEHLLARAGFTQRTVYGDFFKNPLTDNSPSLIWVARIS